MHDAGRARRKVGIAELAVGRETEILVAYGLGSCVGIVLWEARARLGGLAHVMLPWYVEGPGDDDPRKYADRAVEMLLGDLDRLGASRRMLIGKLAGGATMFRENPRTRIGERNVRAAEQVLRGLGIPVVARDVGGEYGRTVEFEVSSGRVLVRSFREGERWI